MSNPTDPTGKPPADENVVRKRMTDPRMRAIPSGEGRPVDDDLPLPPPPRRQASGLNVVRVQEAVEITGTQQRPGFPPQRVPSTPPQRMTSSPPSPAPPPLVDLDSLLSPVGPTPPPPMPMALDDLLSPTPAAPPPPPPLSTGGIARPAPPPPMVPTSSPPRPAIGLDPPVESSSGRVRRPTGLMGLDPPVESSAPTRRPTGLMGLDPPVESSAPTRRPTGLDPPVEPSTPTKRPTGLMSLDPEVEPSTPTKRPGSLSTGSFGRPAEPPPPPRVSTNAVLEAMGIAEEPPPPPPRWPPSWWPMAKMLLAPMAGVLMALVAVVGIAVATFSGGDGPATFTSAEQQRLASLWLKHGSWGQTRSDEVVGAVAEVGSTVVVPLMNRLGAYSVRFLVLKDANEVRAAALPDGTIVVSTGALRRLDSEAQLAALLAHTLAHLALGDVTRALESHEFGARAKGALRTSNPQESTVLLDAIVGLPSGNEKQAMELTLEALKAAGWTAGAMAEVVQRLGAHDGLPATTWLALHPADSALQHTLGQVDKSGRTNIPEYRTRVLDRVGHLGAPPAPTTAPPPTIPPKAAPTPTPAKATAPKAP